MFQMEANAKIIAEPSFGINTSKWKVFFFLTILLFIYLAALGQLRHPGSSLHCAGYFVAAYGLSSCGA